MKKLIRAPKTKKLILIGLFSLALMAILPNIAEANQNFLNQNFTVTKAPNDIP